MAKQAKGSTRAKRRAEERNRKLVLRAVMRLEKGLPITARQRRMISEAGFFSKKG